MLIVSYQSTEPEQQATTNEVEEAAEPEPAPAFLPPPTRVVSSSTPSSTSSAKVQTWIASLTDPNSKKSKSKKKGTLGISLAPPQPTLFFASESDKSAVQQFTLSATETRYTSNDKSKSITCWFGPAGAEDELCFVFSNAKEVQEVEAALEQALSGSSKPPPAVAFTPATPHAVSSVVTGAHSKSAIMLYDFDGDAAEGELSVVDGEKIIVLDDSDVDWWKVRRTSNGEEGSVPASYVEVSTALNDQMLDLSRSQVDEAGSTHSGVHGITAPLTQSTSNEPADEDEQDALLLQQTIENDRQAQLDADQAQAQALQDHETKRAARQRAKEEEARNLREAQGIRLPPAGSSSALEDHRPRRTPPTPNERSTSRTPEMPIRPVMPAPAELSLPTAESIRSGKSEAGTSSKSSERSRTS